MTGDGERDDGDPLPDPGPNLQTDPLAATRAATGTTLETEREGADPLTDPLAGTVAAGGSSIEDEHLREGVRDALFGTGAPVRIDRYRVTGELGAGGMGVVYRAHDDQLGRDVAIKLLRSDGGGTSRRLLREARSMARLTHPNVAVVHDVGTHHDAVYIAMELVDGPSLRRWLDSPRTYAQIKPVMTAAAEGLAAAHAAGLVHRDFKPDNVIVGNDGRVRVLDFGLAKLPESELGSSTDPTTEAGQVLGTPRYMAPEQLRAREVGPAADQFAFCVSLYEAVYGCPPFGGETFAELAVSVLTEGPRTPPDDAPQIEGLWPLLQRGLCTAPEDRHEDMRALIDALQQTRASSETIVSRPGLRDAKQGARDQLGSAFADSLLDADELDQRLEKVENARSPATVDAQLADLQPPPPPRALAVGSPAAPANVEADAALVPATNLPARREPAATSRILALFSGTKRAGHWTPARRNQVRAFFGGIDLDLREADLPPGETVFELTVAFGGVDILVPPGVRVEVDATAIFGGVDQDDPSEASDPDAPVIRITGYVLFGGVDVNERLAGEGVIGAWRRRRANLKKLREAEAGRKALPPKR